MKLNSSALAIFAVVLLSACAAPADVQNRTELWGSPSVDVAATQTIVIGPNTKYVNLVGGDIVRFVVGDKSFTWSFDGAYFPATVDISKVSNGLLQRPVLAYVSVNPMYMGGDSID